MNLMTKFRAGVTWYNFVEVSGFTLAYTSSEFVSNGGYSQKGGPIKTAS